MTLRHTSKKNVTSHVPSRLNSSPLLHIFLLFLFSTVPYSETTSHEWHLDTPANILHNNLLHIEDLHPSTLSKTLYAHPTEPGTLFRPIANLSFAINWFWGKNQPAGYHITNTIIHFFTTLALYFCCFFLLHSPTLKSHILTKQAHIIALLTTSLWTLAPIHTQAITYIVQRMAQLATLFSVTTITFFLLARLATNKRKKITFFFLSFICALFAFGSKENSIILPLSLLLVEFVFFAKAESLFSKLKQNKKKSFFILLTLLSGTIFLYSYYGNGIFNYDHRSFTMAERLLTEPRKLLFHLSQLFFPLASSLSIEHDIVLSSSLFTPWNTLPAILVCIGLICFALSQVRKYPLLSFAILFFFLNHLIESTIIPLELLFEHRNYLPSLFLFLPVATLITKKLCKTNDKYTRRQIFIFVASSAFLILSGVSTYERNKVWATEQSLWEDAIIKAPQSGRAKINLAKSYIESKRYEEAILLCNEADQLVGATQNKLKPISLSSKGTIAYNRGDHEGALALFNSALTLRADFTDTSYKKIQLLTELRRYEEALKTSEDLLTRTEDPQLLLIKGSLLLRLNKPAESLKTYRKARQFLPNSALISVGQGKAMGMLGYYKQADTIFGITMAVNEPDAVFLRIENYLKWGKNKRATRLSQQVLQSTPLQVLLDNLKGSSTGAFQVPFDHMIIKKQFLSLLSGPMYTL